jgi:tRNA-2-methylthio-N6-dimethylallyladenosine synthase
MAGLLKPMHYRMTGTPESADLIIVNTCAIRAKAEQKVFSYLGRLSELKRRKPDLIIAVGGCVAQQEGNRILTRSTDVDLVFGTHAIGRLPRQIARIKRKRQRIVDLDMLPACEDTAFAGETAEKGGVSRFVTIMQGCDNFCTYCVVPHTRGRESSRRPESIIREVADLVDAGVREVTLLGQNVNSYGIKQGRCTFAELLAMVNTVRGLRRIRFTTSHPKDLSPTLVQAFGSIEKLCRHIHLPVQSGSSRILKRMNRRYRRGQYLEKIASLRRHCPDIAISTDVIVGFPGETEADFEETRRLVETVRFDSLFAFMYSDRPTAPASRFSDKVPEAVKNERLQNLLELQSVIGSEINDKLVGAVQTVLVEGRSKKQAAWVVSGSDRMAQWSGRTSGNKIVNFTCETASGSNSNVRPGEVVEVRIERALSHSLCGKQINAGSKSPAAKGTYYAA